MAHQPHFPCQLLHRPLTRRDWLRRSANGFGAVALAALSAQWGAAADPLIPAASPFAAAPPLYQPRARNVIFLYMDGGPSQLDTFDPKPLLDAEHGEPMKMAVSATQFDDVGRILKSPWKFGRYGASGLPVSELFPQLARHVDKMCFVRSMTSSFSEHTNANYFLHTGHGLQGRPSMGAWAGYGLGSESQNLPGFVVLNGGLTPPGGLDNFHSGFLPATFQASVFNSEGAAVSDLAPPRAEMGFSRPRRELLAAFDRLSVEQHGAHEAIDSAIANYELAYRMQTTIPDLLDLSTESQATQQMYGLDSSAPGTQIYARQCLLARRLVEQGVRFVELTCPSLHADRWDQHRNLKDGHERNALATDQPIAGLLTDLEARGLLDSTLVVWAGEFGRTPMAQGGDGRDHNPYGFTIWLAGGGVRGGTAYGATDEYGYRAIENRCDIHDLHATMLHLLGLDHRQLTYRFGGRDMRLTDVHGRVIDGWLA